MSLVQYSELDYKRPTGTYYYPSWAVSVGWGMAGCSAICIPAVAVYNVIAFTLRGQVRHLLVSLNRPSLGSVTSPRR